MAKTTEGMDTMANKRCPDILIQKDNKIYLFDSKVTKVPGVNPIFFENLEEYVEFVEWQRSQGINCPVLFLQHTYGTQGESTYKVRPSPTDLQGGVPPMAPIAIANAKSKAINTLLVDATRNDPPYNKNSYPAYDATSYYVGQTTPLDNLPEEENLLYSPNAMDDNWGGPEFTKSLVDQGYYKGNEVSIAIA
jgi:hypothetical protein